MIRNGEPLVNLILLEPHEVDAAGMAHLDDGRATHALGTLRVTAGAVVRIGLLDGPRGQATVRAVTADGVTLHCQFEADVPPRPPVDLLLALPRPKVLRRLWPQLAALGVDRLMLTNAARVERQYFDTHVLHADGYRPLLIEGLQQAQDTRLPRVSVHKRLKVFVEDELDALVGGGLRLVADPGAPAAIGTTVARLSSPLEMATDAPRTDAARRVVLAIGPEGGWTDFERDLLAAHRFHAVGIGARTLRSDTACVALLALVHAALHARLQP